jgi:hypothetical protein
MIAAILAAGALACNPALQDAALKALAPTLGYGPNSFGVYLGQDNADSLNALAARVKAYRVRVMKMKDPCSRAAYSDWLDWYDERIAEARTELVDHHNAKELQQYHVSDAPSKRRLSAWREPIGSGSCVATPSFAWFVALFIVPLAAFGGMVGLTVINLSICNARKENREG